MSATLFCATFAGLGLSFHLGSIALAAISCRKPGPAPKAPTPPVTLVRPVCGLEPFSRETLSASFQLQWPHYELLFCVARADDPIIPLIKELMLEFPNVDARLLIGADNRYANPKLANMASGWREARHDYIVFLDSNIAPPPDYFHRIIQAWDQEAGMVSAPPVGAIPSGFWSEVECALLNTWQARVQYAVASAGFGFAQGKTLAFPRSMLANGGFESLANEPAEDAAATRLVRSKGLRVRLATPPFPQLIGRKTLNEVWRRQLRWARLRRATFLPLFIPEACAGALPPVLALSFALQDSPHVSAAATAYLAIWYGAEIILAALARWRLHWMTLPAMMMRDLLLPAIFVATWMNSTVVWNGSVVSRPLRPRKAPFMRQLAARWGRNA